MGDGDPRCSRQGGCSASSTTAVSCFDLVQPVHASLLWPQVWSGTVRMPSTCPLSDASSAGGAQQLLLHKPALVRAATRQSLRTHLSRSQRGYSASLTAGPPFVSANAVLGVSSCAGRAVLCFAVSC